MFGSALTYPRANHYRPRLPLVVSAVVLAAALGACGSADETTTKEKASADKSAAKSPVSRDVVAKVGPSIVSVKGQDGDYHSHGTGVILDADRALVLTSNHLIEGAESLTVTINEKDTVKARPLARANCKDIALIGMYPKPDGLVPVDLGDSDEVKAGDDVTALGYPGLKTGSGQEKLAATQGKVAATGTKAELTPRLPEFAELVVHQAPLSTGNSGGPLLNSGGQLIGLNTVLPGAGDGGLFYAIASNQVNKLYGELAEGEKSFYQGWEKYHKCHKEMVRLARSSQVLNHDLPKGAKPRREGSSQHTGH